LPFVGGIALPSEAAGEGYVCGAVADVSAAATALEQYPPKGVSKLKGARTVVKRPPRSKLPVAPSKTENGRTSRSADNSPLLSGNKGTCSDEEDTEVLHSGSVDSTSSPGMSSSDANSSVNSNLSELGSKSKLSRNLINQRRSMRGENGGRLGRGGMGMNRAKSENRINLELLPEIVASMSNPDLASMAIRNDDDSPSEIEDVAACVALLDKSDRITISSSSRNSSCMF